VILPSSFAFIRLFVCLSFTPFPGGVVLFLPTFALPFSHLRLCSHSLSRDLILTFRLHSCSRPSSLIHILVFRVFFPSSLIHTVVISLHYFLGSYAYISMASRRSVAAGAVTPPCDQLVARDVQYIPLGTLVYIRSLSLYRDVARVLTGYRPCCSRVNHDTLAIPPPSLNSILLLPHNLLSYLPTRWLTVRQLHYLPGRPQA